MKAAEFVAVCPSCHAEVRVRLVTYWFRQPFVWVNHSHPKGDGPELIGSINPLFSCVMNIEFDRGKWGGWFSTTPQRG